MKDFDASAHLSRRTLLTLAAGAALMGVPLNAVITGIHSPQIDQWVVERVDVRQCAAAL